MVSGLRIQFTALRPKQAPLATSKTKAALEKYTRNFALELIKRVSVYPNPPPDSEYVRTYQLREKWKPSNSLRRINSGDAIRYEVRNDARDKQVSQVRGGRSGDYVYTYTRRRGRYYARWVHGPNTQAGIHAETGWRNIGDELERLGGRGRFRDGAQAVINKRIGVR